MSAKRETGASMVEFAIALPLFMMAMFVVAELSLMYQAKSVVDLAALAAARAGAVAGVDRARMLDAAIGTLLPLYLSGDPQTDARAYRDARNEASEDTGRLYGITPNEVRADTLLNGPDTGREARGIHIDVISPTRRMAGDFGVMRVKGSERQWVIPNDNLMYRDRSIVGMESEANIQDANLLKIRLTYLYKTRLPLTHYFFTPFIDGNLMSRMYGDSPADPTSLNANPADYYRVPLVSYATVRMQSDVVESNLP